MYQVPAVFRHDLFACLTYRREDYRQVLVLIARQPVVPESCSFRWLSEELWRSSSLHSQLQACNALLQFHGS